MKTIHEFNEESDLCIPKHINFMQAGAENKMRIASR